MTRYQQIMLKAEKGISFDVVEGTNGIALIRAYQSVADKSNSANYINPPIPDGYQHVCGEWDNGFVIERVSDKSQFVWVPVGSLDDNGTLDGVLFNWKFGRRHFGNNNFSKSVFFEPMTKEFSLQIESVKKYEGFYISRYNISVSLRGTPQSVKGAFPWTNVNLDVAKEIASDIENTESVKSHLIFGSEYDSVLEWFIESDARTPDEIIKDSSKWGNHWNTKNPPRDVLKTGEREEWCTNNIYDFAGNVDEWTQEWYKESFCVIRGGDFSCFGYDYPVAYRGYDYLGRNNYYTGLRAALYIK